MSVLLQTLAIAMKNSTTSLIFITIKIVHFLFDFNGIKCIDCEATTSATAAKTNEHEKSTHIEERKRHAAQTQTTFSLNWTLFHFILHFHRLFYCYISFPYKYSTVFRSFASLKRSIKQRQKERKKKTKSLSFLSVFIQSIG